MLYLQQIEEASYFSTIKNAEWLSKLQKEENNKRESTDDFRSIQVDL